MKYYLSILILLIHFLSTAQTSFKIDENQLIWQKIYKTEATVQSIEKHLLNLGFIDNLKISNNQIIANIVDLTIDYKSIGGSEMFTSMYISRSDFFATLIIDIKENRYRATIKNIKAIQNYDDGLTAQGEKTNLELFGLKKKNSEFRKSFLKNDVKFFESTFSKILTINDIDKSNDW